MIGLEEFEAIQYPVKFDLFIPGNSVNDNEVYHDGDIFLEDYKEMNRSFKIYVYPISQDDPYANILLPINHKPRGNYASEHYFKQVLMKSHFITKDPKKADLFFMPFSVANMRVDRRIDVPGIRYFVRDYVLNISQKYPYWNRTGGADHFYVTCHSIGKSATLAATYVKLNAIEVVCSANYFVPSYIPHKDASMPQIWPRHEDPPNLASSERKKLAFFAGRNNSPARAKVHQIWGNDREILVHFDWVSNIAEEQLGSKFCLHVKGYEVNTARAADSLFYGCVPVIIANYYHLPFADIINWKSFSVIVEHEDIPLLKKILKGMSSEKYLMLQRNVLKVRKHFQWHFPPVDYDAFYMTMYELWLRRSSVKSRLRFGLWTKALGIDRGRGKIGSFSKAVPEKEGNLSGNVAKPKENGLFVDNAEVAEVSMTGAVGRNGLENMEVSDISVNKGFINGISWNQLETMIL
ncbi:hypothetical protein JRO89_XS04G0119700 [Xanthoceras sorbifolium]|uniref:Exostosin GT47 domain-containing protein n=1 Tax=Xanthoceras sorbifolium TaxID=99658 RepID=A0ABQ8I5H7_9ROSI|nr:hypothetical protein JRO89_XS04G0119700 [Xanthoceras sorbifolium]